MDKINQAIQKLSLSMVRVGIAADESAQKTLEFTAMNKSLRDRTHWLLRLMGYKIN